MHTQCCPPLAPPVGRGVERKLHTLRFGGTHVRNHLVPPVGVAQILRGPRPSRVRRVQAKHEVRKSLSKRVYDKWRRQKLYKVDRRTVPLRPYNQAENTEPTNTYKPHRTRYGEATSHMTPIELA